uniref:Solute carrier organic anion transporter family member n=1 Tax=Macrostomum lignano TaxID=282301 RepID=A0A1I8HUF4_9PLAT
RRDKMNNRKANSGQKVEQNYESKMSPVVSEVEENEEFKDNPDEVACNWHPKCQPQCCQCFARPSCLLLWLCLSSFTQGLVVNGFVNSVLTTLELRYDMTSSESGLIASMYDIGSVLCLVPVTYIGHRYRRSRLISIGLLIMSVGSFVFTIPQFTTDAYNYQSPVSPLCYLSGKVYPDFCTKQTLNNYKFVFWLGQFLHGVGASPLYTLAVAYLDDNLTVQQSGAFLGAYYMMSLIGPAMGYLLGGIFLNIYVELGVTPSDLTPSNTSLWVGAWWVGFLISGTLSLIIVVPLFGFPKLFPGSARIQHEKKQETHGNSEAKCAEMQELNVKDFCPSVGVILSNPVFVFISFSGAADAILVAGLSTFGPKVLQTLFMVSASTATLTIGLVSVPSAAIGLLVGGLVIRFSNLPVRSLLWMCVGVAAVDVLFGLGLLAKCDLQKFAGVNQNYPLTPNQSNSLNATCNMNCHCQESKFMYSPVCGADSVIYYSPCYAGCQSNATMINGAKYYANCTCITGQITANNYNFSAMEGTCKDASCNKMPIVLVTIGFFLFGIFFISIPTLQCTMRPVDGGCGHQGSCSFYNGESFWAMVLGFAAVLKALEILFLILAAALYVPPDQVIQVDVEIETKPDATPSQIQEVEEPKQVAAKSSPKTDDVLKSDSNELNDDPDEVACNWHPKCQPQCCQCFARPSCLLLWLCLSSFTQGLVVNGFVNSVLTTLELRYDMTSSESGLIASMYDIGSVLCLVPVTYIGHRYRRSRLISIGLLTMSVGSFVFTIPQFTTDAYNYQSPVSPLCYLSGKVYPDFCTKQTLNNYKFVFWLGQFLHGVGASPLYTLAVAYLDDNLTVQQSGAFLGAYYMMSLIGPAMGYLLGGIFLQYLRRAGRDATQSRHESPRDIVGAENAATQISAKHFWSSIVTLLKNATFVFLSFSGAMQYVIMTGLSTFGPKILQILFYLTKSSSTITMGLVTVPAAAFGVMTGGLLIRFTKFSVQRLLWLSFIVACVDLILGLGLLAKCNPQKFAGVNQNYPLTPNQSNSLNATCNMNCHCQESKFMYSPVCGADSVIYYSPCYAGCQSNGTMINGAKYYADCTCITGQIAIDGSDQKFSAVEGACIKNACHKLQILLSMLFLFIFVLFSTSVPILHCTMRVIPATLKDFGLGLQWMILRLFGSIPGPPLMGKLIDTTCSLWTGGCGHQGSCSFYNGESFWLIVIAFAGVLKVLEVALMGLAAFFYYAPPDEPETYSSVI